MPRKAITSVVLHPHRPTIVVFVHAQSVVVSIALKIASSYRNQMLRYLVLCHRKALAQSLHVGVSD